MDVSLLVAYRGTLLVAGLVGVVLLSQALQHRRRRPIKPFVLLVVGALLYIGVKLVVSLVRGTPTVFAVTRFNVLGATLATTGFLLFVVEHTGVERPITRRTAALLSIEPLVAFGLVLADVEFFWVPAGRDPATLSGYAWQMTSVAVANQLYLGILMLVGILLLIRFGLRSDRAFATQIGLLVGAGLIPTVANLVYLLGDLPLNPTPIAFVFSGLLIAWAIFRESLLDLAPIGKGAVVDNLDAGVLTFDSDHRLVDVNAAGRAVFDLGTAEDPIGTPVEEMFEDGHPFGDLYWASIEDPPEQDLEMQVADRHYGVSVTALTTTGGQALGRSFVVRDITERVTREQELREFEEAAEHAGHGLMITDDDETITFVNSAMEEQTGYSAEELLGSTPRLLSSGDHADAFYQSIWDCLLDGNVWEGEVINQRKSGERYTVEQTISPITNDGDILAFVSVNKDISERKEYAQRIEDQRDGLVLLNQVLRHDIRNDLQLILSWAKVLERDDHVDAEGREHVDTILRNTQDAVDLTESAKDLADVILSPSTDRSAVDIASVIEREVRSISSATETGTVRIEDRIPATAVAADDMLDSVFRNLLKNAIQHNDTDRPAVTVSAVEHDEHMEIRVADNGPGVPDGQKEVIFGRGERGLESEGTGIGLYLVDTLVGRYGGEVWVEDEDPRGAVFVVTLPLAE